MLQVRVANKLYDYQLFRRLHVVCRFQFRLACYMHEIKVFFLTDSKEKHVWELQKKVKIKTLKKNT